MTTGRTGCCPSCHGTHQLRIDGSLRRHPSARKRTCPGSGGTNLCALGGPCWRTTETGRAAVTQLTEALSRRNSVTIIAIDFDGTLVEYRYPDIGPDVPGAFEWVRKLQDAGAKLILWTMRDGDTLAAAVEHCRARGIEFWGVNANPDQSWSTSPKQYAHAYIDDANLYCPVKLAGRRAVVDWDIVGPAALKLVTA